jgi:hypothetical protein
MLQYQFVIFVKKSDDLVFIFGQFHHILVAASLSAADWPAGGHLTGLPANDVLNGLTRVVCCFIDLFVKVSVVFIHRFMNSTLSLLQWLSNKRTN